jgi:hypothetical protein
LGLGDVPNFLVDARIAVAGSGLIVFPSCPKMIEHGDTLKKAIEWRK